MKMLDKDTTRLSVLLAAVITTASGVAVAKPPITRAQEDAARAAYASGEKLFNKGQCQAALTQYVVADDTLAFPATRTARAEALACLGRLMEARATARTVASLRSEETGIESHAHARDRAAKLVAALDIRIPRLSFEPRDTAPIDARVTVDGTVVPPSDYQRVDVDPGLHRVRVEAAGYRPLDMGVDVDARAREVVPLVLTPLPQTSLLGPVGWTGIGMASVGVIAGTVAGLVALDRASEDANTCTEMPASCGELSVDRDGRVLTAAHVSTVGFLFAGLGGAAVLGDLLAGGATGDESVSVTPMVGLGTVGLKGTF